MESCEAKVEVGGRELFVGTGKLAKQASGAVTIRYGDCVLLVAVTHSNRESFRDYFPLSVDFEERMYAAGKFPGGFIKRESRPSTDAIIAARVVDRSIRPLFPKDYKYEVQVVCFPFSSDMENPIDTLGLIGASLATSISDIPFECPVAGVRIGRGENGEFVVNPTYEQIESGNLDIVVAGSEDAIMMVEGEADEITEDQFLEALDLAHVEIKKIIEMQKEIISKVAKAKMEYDVREPDEDLIKKVKESITPKIQEAMDGKGKKEREGMMRDILKEAMEEFGVDEEGNPDTEKASDIYETVEKTEKQVMRELIWEKGVRADGRKLDEIREISSDVGLLPRTHGSAVFTRGQTQVLSIVTLSTVGDAQKIDTITQSTSKRYFHQYNFPPFSVGETKPMRGPSRRDIGHGNLAERALVRMIPSEEEFNYAIRVVSEVLESNGSSSMASVCGSTMSLLDAGVPIKKPVSGIAMGLILKDINDYKILTDIQGLEDHNGDMDFKVAGTRDGITAVQMDIKVAGITREIMSDAMAKAKEARLFILGKMEETISAPREELSQYAPRLITVKLPVDKIGTVIGPGGKTIRGIVEETGAQIDINDDGMVLIYSSDISKSEQARDMVKALIEEAKVGGKYKGEVKRIVGFGAFVQILPHVDGLLHISQLADHRVDKVEDVVKIGDEVEVIVREIDEFGRVNLSMANLTKKSGDDKKGGDRGNDRKGGPPRRKPDNRRNDRR